VSLFDRLFGKTREAAMLARRAELEGDLARAAQLWAEADRSDEAARVMLLRGDAEADSLRRLSHYVQAAALAPEGHAIRNIARKKRALLALGIARAGVSSAAARQDLLSAGQELEELGETAHAAEAYALAGDLEGETRALVQGGEVERLEDMLDRDQDRARGERRQREAAREIDRLLASGERREALARAEELVAAGIGDAEAGERARRIRSNRAAGSTAAVELRGRRILLVLGDEVVIGRSETGEGAIQIASHAVSRRHLELRRRDGVPEVRDLGSRNGTTLRGLRIEGALRVPPDDALELRLGGEVPLRLSLADELQGALAIEVAGTRYVAPLGPARLGVGPWRLATGTDGWHELVTDDDAPAYLGQARVGNRVSLLAGDAFSESRGGDVVLRVGQAAASKA